VSALGTAILVISALSFTRALQRLYERAWRLPSLGLRGNVAGFEWLLVFSAYLALHPILVPDLPPPFGIVISGAVGAGLWLLTPWLLLARRVPARALLLQAVLTTVGLNALIVASAIYMPHAVSSSASQFGVIGVAFSLLSWLFLAGLVLVVAAALGARPRDADRLDLARAGG
jgi:membrane protein